MIRSGRNIDKDGLEGEVYGGLFGVLRSAPSVRKALEMKWILLLIISTMRELSGPVATDKDTWIEDILELAEHGGSIRQETGETVASFFQEAPWSWQKQDGSSSVDTVRSINYIFAGVVGFTRQLDGELKKMEESGVVLAVYNVEEAGSEEDGTEDETTATEMVERPSKKPRKKRSTAPKRSTASRVKLSPSAAGSGNHDHGRAIPWTTPEHIGLLELYRDNTDRKLVGHPRIAELHNSRFWPRFGEGRTSAAVSQQYLKLVQHDIALIPAKLLELQGLLDEGL